MSGLTVRRVLESDARLTWQWANDPVTRQMAFSQKPIPWSEHQGWFAGRLASPSCYWYICEGPDGRPLGQVRFDIETAGVAEVDVSIAKEARGRGYGRQAIEVATRALFRDAPGARRAVAHVRPENEVSLRVFAGAGYTKIGDCPLQGVLVAELVRERRSREATVYVGGVEVSWHCLAALCEADVVPVLVFGYDAKLGRRAGFRSLRDLQGRYGFNLVETDNINGPENVELIKAVSPTVIFVIGWSQIVRKEILRVSQYGAVGIHPTRLPEGRGRAPIPWTIIRGLEWSAVTLFCLDAGADDGDIIAREEFSVTPFDDAASVYQKARELHVKLLLGHLEAILNGSAPREAQDQTRATFWPRRRPADGQIEWTRSAWEIYNWIRALTDPYPGAFTQCRGSRLYIWKADVVLVDIGTKVPPGTILGKVYGTGDAGGGVIVAAVSGMLVLRRVQFEAEEAIEGAALVEESRLTPGVVLGD